MNGTSLVNGNGHLKYSANLVDNDTNLNGTNTFGNKNSIKMATNGTSALLLSKRKVVS